MKLVPLTPERCGSSKSIFIRRFLLLSCWWQRWLEIVKLRTRNIWSFQEEPKRKHASWFELYTKSICECTKSNPNDWIREPSKSIWGRRSRRRNFSLHRSTLSYRHLILAPSSIAKNGLDRECDASTLWGYNAPLVQTHYLGKVQLVSAKLSWVTWRLTLILILFNSFLNERTFFSNIEVVTARSKTRAGPV